MKATLFLIFLALPFSAAGSASYDPPQLPEKFDPLGPTVQQLVMPDGRTVHYIDDGKSDWRPVVFTGGLGTSVRVIRLLDFLRTMRNDLKLRFITVERNGFGQTAYDPSLEMADFAADVEAVLAHLGIEKFAVFGISGGGPYTAKIASLNVDRLLSVHMAATSPLLGQSERCGDASPTSSYLALLRRPMQYFGFPASSPMHQVAGFQDTAYDEAARAHFVRGQMADTAPLIHESGLYCREGRIDTSNVKVPVFIYSGLADAVLGDVELQVWHDAFPSAEVTIRTYAGEGHDVQYRHLDQILLDLAGFGDRVLVCRNCEHKMIEASDLRADDVQGLCAWQR
ncbi:MAG: alpha/beta hydrolase [Gammaproteobacteria bacterium]